ncbi:MAG TPA: DUF4331 family protein [Gemmatimonadaceae bacterium]|jgi:hypothetical protein|nr:DUF4331 family protein [Gemmatimonadaceae bacterium]
MPRSTLGLIAAVALAALACGNDNTKSATGPSTTRLYDQVQRLGNPLVSEVFLAKRSHPTHGAIGPAQDTIIEPEFKNFVATVAGRDTIVQNTLAAVLLPDMLIVQTDKDPSTAGWLTWALANGYGGRKLTDDVVAAGLDAIFGTLIETAGNNCPGLCNDNVPAHTDYQTTFPYLGNPN